MMQDQRTIPFWSFNLQKLHPTFIGECEKAIKWASEIVSEWLISGMFNGEADARNKAASICGRLNDHSTTYAHARHIHMDKAREIGLKIVSLEDDQSFKI